MASKEIVKLPKIVAIQVFENIKMLGYNPKPIGHKKLKGIKEDIFRIIELNDESRFVKVF